MVPFPVGEKISFIAAGADFSLALSGSLQTVYAWGNGVFGNLGDGFKEDRAKPTPFHIFDPRFPLVNTPLKVIQVSAGSRHVIALCEPGQVFS